MGYALWNWGLKHSDVSRAGIYTAFETLVGVLLGVALLHETLAAAIVGGGVLIIAAGVLSAAERQRPDA